MTTDRLDRLDRAVLAIGDALRPSMYGSDALAQFDAALAALRPVPEQIAATLGAPLERIPPAHVASPQRPLTETDVPRIMEIKAQAEAGVLGFRIYDPDAPSPLDLPIVPVAGPGPVYDPTDTTRYEPPSPAATSSPATARVVIMGPALASVARAAYDAGRQAYSNPDMAEAEGWNRAAEAVVAAVLAPVEAEVKRLNEECAGLMEHAQQAACAYADHGGCCGAEGGECSVCSVRDCPHGEPLHYHHDGCPCCDGTAARAHAPPADVERPSLAELRRAVRFFADSNEQGGCMEPSEMDALLDIADAALAWAAKPASDGVTDRALFAACRAVRP